MSGSEPAPRRGQRLWAWISPALLFVLAFVPRAIYPVSRSMLWYYRAIHFSDALAARDWAGTLQSYHPGVTTMWIAAAGIRLFAWRRGLSSGQLLGMEPAGLGTVASAVAAGVVALALVVALCVLLSYLVLKRIAGHKVAFVAGCLLALDPFYLAQSKVLHVDALLASFMAVSALCLLSHVHGARWRDLVLSGVFAALAFLTKTPSLFLIPYAALVLGVWQLGLLGNERALPAGWGAWSRHLWTVIRGLLLWGGVALVVFVALWPLLWVDPMAGVGWMRDRTVVHVETPNVNQVYFNGKAVDDPGLPFYAATIGWKTTLVTLPMACAAIGFALYRARRKEPGGVVWLLVAYVVSFTLQMGLAAREEVRYLLPAFLALDVLAAFGLVWSVRAVSRLRRLREARWLPAVLIGVALALQAGVVLPRHPYYGTHYNLLLGGARVAQRILPLQDQGEGLDRAARYLDTLPRASQARALIHPLGGEMFERYFIGFTTVEEDPWTSYRVYTLNEVARNLGGAEREAAWEADRQTEPLWTAAFGGVTYVWVYGEPPGEPAAGGPEQALELRFGEHIRLTRARLSGVTVASGEDLVVVLIWESDGTVAENYQVFCHLLSEGGELVAQHDSPPIYGVRPTPSWRAGEVIEDAHVIHVGEDVAPGAYELSVGMYDLETLGRLPIRDATGERLPEDRVVLGTVRVE